MKGRIRVRFNRLDINFGCLVFFYIGCPYEVSHILLTFLRCLWLALASFVDSSSCHYYLEKYTEDLSPVNKPY